MRSAPRLSLTLYYISGHEPSHLAQGRLQAILSSLEGIECDLEMVDVSEQPERAEADRILACPTLVRREPGPVRRIIGDLSSRHLVQEAIGLA